MDVIYLPHEGDSVAPEAAGLPAVIEDAEGGVAREVAAVRVHVPKVPLIRTTSDRTVFALGATAGVGAALVLAAALSPLLHRSTVSPHQTFAAPVIADDAAPAVVFEPAPIHLSAPAGQLQVANVQVLPDLTVTAPLLPPQAPHRQATVAEVAEPPKHEVLRGPAIPRKPLPAAAAPVERVATVLYRAAPAAAPQAQAEPSEAAPAPRAGSSAASEFSVISIPSSGLALIASKVNGQMLVSPYKVGQSLPDGRVITALDPATRTVLTDRGRLTGS